MSWKSKASLIRNCSATTTNDEDLNTVLDALKLGWHCFGRTSTSTGHQAYIQFSIAALLHQRLSEVAPRLSGLCSLRQSPVVDLSRCSEFSRYVKLDMCCGHSSVRSSTDRTPDEGQPGFFAASTATWTDFVNGVPNIQNGNLTTYGTNTGAYLPLPSNECGPSGGCSNNGGRWVGWIDGAPLLVGTTKAYAWLLNIHFNSSGAVDNNPGASTALYRINYAGNTDATLPTVTLVNQNYWPTNSNPYGQYGSVIGTDGFAYLYGAAKSGIVVARVDPAKIESGGPYTYYSAATGVFSSTKPAFNDASASIPNCGSGQQGTFYYSSTYGLYIWIGGELGDDSRFLYTTAPNPWGPWDQPIALYTPTPGTSFNGYSQQAHPGLSTNNGNGKDIWLSYTRINHYYENILFKVTFN